MIDRVESLQELEQYCKNSLEFISDDLTSIQETPLSTPKLKKKNLAATALDAQQFNEDPSGIIAKKRMPVDDHMPPFPPAHSYMQTKVN